MNSLILSQLLKTRRNTINERMITRSSFMFLILGFFFTGVDLISIGVLYSSGRKAIFYSGWFIRLKMVVPANMKAEQNIASIKDYECW